MMRTIAKMLAPLKRMIMLMIGRCVLTAVDDSGGLQTLQLKIYGRPVEDVERMQDFGVSSVPMEGFEAIYAHLGGSASHPVVLAVVDRDCRPVDQPAGSTILYNAFGDQVRVLDGKVVVASDEVLLGESAVRKLIDERMIDVYNLHTHSTTSAGSPTGAPILQTNAAAVATLKTLAE